jgi:nicotinate-nucleotide adenylyltransferase
MKTLCLGGSFNPINHGHLICARAAAEKAGFERILLIPTGQPPHKANAVDLAAGAHRLQMCRLAIEIGLPSSHTGPDVTFAVSDVELTRTGPSYTLDTVRQLKNEGWGTITWLIGADMLNYLPNWHEHATLLREAEFLIIGRPGVPIKWETLPPHLAPLKDKVIEAPLVEISSTDIRERVRRGLSIAYMTPEKVADYIRSNGLYRDQGYRNAL